VTRRCLVGVNHVALEVGDVAEELDFYGRIFEFELRGRGPGTAFIDIGDQFIALMAGRTQEPEGATPLRPRGRRQGANSARARRRGVEIAPCRSLDLRRARLESVRSPS
jgi:catechol 2,3-dioxygenase-like lactoylglutathione lyase family enzyme